MSIVKYMTRWGTITRVEVERETDASVYIKGRRCAKENSYEKYHDTWADAHAYLMDRQKEKVEGLRRQLEQANAALGNIKGMKPPKDAP